MCHGGRAKEEWYEDDRYFGFITFNYIHFPGCATEWVNMAFGEIFKTGWKYMLNRMTISVILYNMTHESEHRFQSWDQWSWPQLWVDGPC